MFNALKYSEELEKVGFSADQAQASMKVLMDVMNENFTTNQRLSETEFALRSDLRAVENSLRSEIKNVETVLRSEIKDLRTDMKELEYKLTIKLGTMMTLAIGATATLLKVLHTV